MKTSFCLFLGLLLAGTLQAQVLRPEGVSHRGGQPGRDLRPAATERASGYIYRDRHVATSRPHLDASHHRSSGGYGYRGHRGYSVGYGYWGPSYYHRPGFAYSYYPGYGSAYPYYDTAYPYYDYGAYGYGTPSYAGRGLFLGGLAGAIIGHNSGTFRHDAWRGAAWGAGAGWLLGTIADARRAQIVQSAPVGSVPAQTAAPAAAQPQQVTIINNYYNAPATPMSGANGLFGRQ
jgi:hypothetical protein